MKDIFKVAIQAAIEAGYKIMEIYKSEDFEIEQKQDDSPLTVADREANKIINAALVPTGIPVISEENDQIPYSERRNWTECWIVDPLDGTKEFIKKNGEFTVNIAFVRDGKPEFGVIYAPDLNLLYYGIVEDRKAYKATVVPGQENAFNLDSAQQIMPDREMTVYKVVGSRSHMNEETKEFIDNLKSTRIKDVEIVSRGSSLKFCLVAEGQANVYPRFGPTMEWDTAAGQALCEAVGVNCIFCESKQLMTYNKENLRNGNFVVSYDG